MNFSLDQIRVVQFGVGRDDVQYTFCAVAVDQGVQQALAEMARTTWTALQAEGDGDPYEPAEKYGPTEHLLMALEDPLAQRLRDLHEAANLQMDNNALADPANVFCYFTRFIDAQGRRLTALRRSTQFKSISNNRLINFVDDTFTLVPNRVFRLDHDYDLLIDSDNVHILRSASFESVGKLQGAVLAATPQNIAELQRDLPFFQFDSVLAYSGTRPRAARYLASIRARGVANINRDALVRACARAGVVVQEVNGQLVVEEDQVMGLLEVLDHRRYEVDLDPTQPVQYRAQNRQRVGAGR